MTARMSAAGQLISATRPRPGQDNQREAHGRNHRILHVLNGFRMLTLHMLTLSPSRTRAGGRRRKEAEGGGIKKKFFFFWTEAESRLSIATEGDRLRPNMRAENMNAPYSCTIIQL